MTDHNPKCLAYGFGPGQRMDICICTGIRIGRADALSRFSITEFPNGKIQTLIADGTHWVTVSTANSMVERARADLWAKVDLRASSAAARYRATREVYDEGAMDAYAAVLAMLDEEKPQPDEPDDPDHPIYVGVKP